MTTATAPATWPPAAQLDDAERSLFDTCNLLDEIHLTCLRFWEGDTEVPAPTLEDLGRLARFVDVAEAVLETMQSYVRDVERGRKGASTRIEEESDAR